MNNGSYLVGLAIPRQMHRIEGREAKWSRVNVRLTAQTISIFRRFGDGGFSHDKLQVYLNRFRDFAFDTLNQLLD